MLEFLDKLDELELQVSQEAALLIDSQSDMFPAFKMATDTHSIDRENAMAILKNVPSMESISPNEFTMFPTATNINVAIEGFWAGIASGLEKLFDLMFSLIFGVLKLLFKPIEWLVGGSGNDGATEKAVKTLEKLEKSDKPEVVEDGDRDALHETIDEVVDNNNLNEFEFKAIVHSGETDYVKINDYIRRLYETMWKSTRKFIEAHGKVEGGDGFYRSHKDLDDIATGSGNDIAKIANEFLGDVGGRLDLGSTRVANIKEAQQTFKRLEDQVRVLESRSVDSKLVKQHYRNKLNRVRSFVNQLRTDLDFEKSDRQLLTDVDKYTDQFNKLQDKLDKLSERNLEDSALTPDDIKELRDTVNNQLTAIRGANAFVKTMFMVSIKGKRAFFKGIRITNQVTNDSFAKIKRMTDKAKG